MEGPSSGPGPKSATVEASVPRSIDDAPQEGQKVLHNDRMYSTVKEGLAYILVPQVAKNQQDPKEKKDDPRNQQSVFYNPIQQFNRDLSVLAIRAYAEDLMVVREAKSQKGARGRKRKRKGGTEGGQSQAAHGDDTEKPGALSNGFEKAANSQASLVQVEDDETGELREIGNAHVNGANTKDAQDIAEFDHKEDTRHDTRKRGRFKILDALSATGLRALRYAQEIPQVTSVTANDLSKAATGSIKTNVQYNKLEDRIEVVTSNAMSHMYSLLSSPVEYAKPPKYDVIDLDPYGTAVPFLDASVQAVSDGGLLCVTCTDSAIWASCGYPEKTYSQYGGTPIKGMHSHEGGLRLILHAIATSAARYGMSVEPMLSLSIDFYARLFVRIHHSPAEVKMLAGKTMLVYTCDGGCGAWSTQPVMRNQLLNTKNGQSNYKHSLAQGPTSNIYCDHCGSKTHVSGPMYAGPIHNPTFISSILNQLPTLDTSTYQTTSRLEGMLTTALEETILGMSEKEEDSDPWDPSLVKRPIPKADATEVDRFPFYFVPSALAKIIHTRAPSEAEVRGALKHAGYAVTRSHARPGTIKTNAPWSFIWHMIREWARQVAPIKDGAIRPGTPGYGIMHGAQARHREQDQRLRDADVQVPNADKAGNPVNPIEKSTKTEQTATAQPDSINGDLSHKKTVVFDEALGKEPNKRRLKRYQENPRANWGPMSRAAG